MAFSSKLLSFLLLTSLFIISTQARDTQFFSRFTRHPDPTTTTTTNTNPATEFYNPTTTTTTTNENDEFSSLTKLNKENINPTTFTPEASSGAGYGLYGRQTTLFPPPTTRSNDNNAFESKNYVPELKGLSEFTNNENNKKDDNKYYYDGRMYKRNGEGVGSYGGVEKQGMSDTRYLENGRYFYDVNAEKNNINQNNYKGGYYNSYGANYMPNYNTNYGGNYKENEYYGGNYKEDEYYGGNNDEFYSGNSNNFNGNAMQGGYQQNQKTFNDEFEFDP